MSERTVVAVVGAGITGLSLGYHLARAGVPHVVLEAEGRPGGVIRSDRVEGHLVEWGPQRTRLTIAMQQLVAELGLGPRVLTAPSGLPLYVYRAGRLREVPFSVGQFLRSDIVSFWAKLRAAAEPLTAPARDDESVADYFIRKLGRHVYENIAGPLYGGLYASDPAEMVVGLSLRHLLREVGVERSLLATLLRRGGAVDPPPACSFIDGMEELPRALYESDRANVVLEAPVLGLEASGRGWRVESESRTVEADRVILTTPARAAARLLAEAAPTAAAAIRRLHYNPLAVVHLRAHTELVGLGYQVSLAERLATRGVTFNDSLFDREGVYTAYLGGSRAPEVVGWSDTEIGTVAVREFQQVTAYEARPLWVEREAMPAWDASWAALIGISLPPGLRIAANWESRPGLPGRLAQAKRLAEECAREAGGHRPVSA
ncbi:MAG: protoporphyrinogen oxidase [Gemmatimonas sp.]|nr:protoporphyrinogen oxidase [Gemmatimonas sp.]